MIRVGIGYDIHPLVNGRPLILGGISIPYHKGLDGHSDADVLCHAVADALLGAAALGDIGEHFPDTDPVYHGISSLMLLAAVYTKISKAGYSIVNVDSTVIAEAPKLIDYKKAMQNNIAQVLQIGQSHVSVKATTNEGFDSIGSKKAIAAFATVCLNKI